MVNFREKEIDAGTLGPPGPGGLSALALRAPVKASAFSLAVVAEARASGGETPEVLVERVQEEDVQAKSAACERLPANPSNAAKTIIRFMGHRHESDAAYSSRC